MHAYVASHTLQLLCKREELAYLILILLAFGQLLLFFLGHLNGHILTWLIRNKFGNAVYEVIALLKNATYVTDGGSCSHRSKGSNLTHRLFAILIFNVLNHTVTPVLAKVDIEVGHRYPLWIEEAFKEQVVAQRIKISNT